MRILYNHNRAGVVHHQQLLTFRRAEFFSLILGQHSKANLREEIPVPLLQTIGIALVLDADVLVVVDLVSRRSKAHRRLIDHRGSRCTYRHDCEQHRCNDKQINVFSHDKIPLIRVGHNF